MLSSQAAALTGPPHVATLEPLTLQHPMLLSEPTTTVTHGVTLGMDAIKAAGTVLLIATGAHKADAVGALFDCEPGDPRHPASTLRSHPGRALLICDAAAAQKLTAPTPQ